MESLNRMAYNRIETSMLLRNPPYMSRSGKRDPGRRDLVYGPAGSSLRGSTLSSIILDDQPQRNTHTNGRNIRTHPFGIHVGASLQGINIRPYLLPKK